MALWILPSLEAGLNKIFDVSNLSTVANELDLQQGKVGKEVASTWKLYVFCVKTIYSFSFSSQNLFPFEDDKSQNWLAPD